MQLENIKVTNEDNMELMDRYDFYRTNWLDILVQNGMKNWIRNLEIW